MLREQVGQVLTIVVMLLDRVLLTGILYRSWSAEAFELWSSLLAMAGLLSLFELGLNLYVNNRLTIEIERGNTAAATRVFATVNFLLSICASAGLACVLALTLMPGGLAAVGLPSTPEIVAALILLAIGMLLRTAGAAAYALYRAHRQFSRLTIILIVCELLRIFLVAAVATTGHGLLHAAIATFVAVAVCQAGFVWFDTAQRFAPHRFAFAIPTRTERQRALGVAFGYFAQNTPFVMLTHVPVIALSALNAGTGIVSAFVLVRTLTGLPRAILQQLGIVAGQEVGRRLAVNDAEGALATLGHAARAFSGLSGLAAGFLFAAGPVIGAIWTGDRSIVRPDLLLAGLVPMLLAPTSVLSHNVLASTNTPQLAAIGRWLQFLLASAVAAFAPIDNLTLRMLIALSVGEIAGYAPLAVLGTKQLMPRAAVPLGGAATVVCVAAACFGAIVTFACLRLAPTGAVVSTIVALGVSLALCGASFIWFGVDAGLRSALFSGLIRTVRVRVATRKPKP